MKRITLGLALLTAVGPALAVAPSRAPATYREGEIIVKYRDGAQSPAAFRLRSDLGLVPLNRLLRGRAEHLRLPGFLTVPGALSALSRDPAVEYAEPNSLRFARTVVPDDNLFAQQWGLRNTGQANFVPGGPAGVAGADMNLIAAWDADGDGTADRVGDGSTIVAVIDDAVDTTHPDLVSNIVAGFNFVNNTTNVNPSNSGEFHGTLVAGCVAATGNNGYGVSGTAWNVKIMPLKFGFDEATHLAAIEFARANGARIINASFGGPTFSQAEQDAIAGLQDDDVLYVAAGGNDDSNTDVAELNYPGNLDADNIVAVAATNRQDGIASFSQYGPITVDVAAPGLQIVTTAPNSSFTTSGVSGTSFSSPYVAGIAALIRSHVAGVGWRDVKARLIESGGAVSGANPKQRTTGGRVDADRALDMAAGPSLVVDSVVLSGGDDNGRLDPGESLTLHLTVRNIWQAATSATAALAATTGVTVNTGAVNLGDVAADAVATADFDLSVDPAVTGHRYVAFTATLGAGTYAATRSFILEIGHLANGVTATQTFAASSVDLYDEFHAWSFDLASLPAGHNQLVIETSSSASGVSSPDIDLLVKRDAPPRYDITVGINPEEPGFFCTSGDPSDNCRDPATLISGRFDGNESVVINNPAPGTYHIVIVNFAQLDQTLTYTLRATTRVAPTFHGGGGGGGMPLPLLAGLLGAALARRLLRAA
jgi:hypothetical protein